MLLLLIYSGSWCFISGPVGVGMIAQGWKSMSDNDSALGRCLKTILIAERNIDAARISLCDLAEDISAKVKPTRNKFEIDIDADGIYHFAFDWFKITNLGAELLNVTIEVELISANGEKRKNIHFLEKWPDNKQMFAGYVGGVTSLDKKFSGGTTTVNGIQKANVRVFSSTLSAVIVHYYQGKDKNIEQDT